MGADKSVKLLRDDRTTIFHSIQSVVVMNQSKKDVARGLRLRDERIRLDLIQLKACAIAGVLEQAWVRYEKGEPFKLDVIQPLQEAGFDMIYVIFGLRTQERPLTASEQSLLRLFHATSVEQQGSLMLLVETFAKTHPAP